SLLIALAIIFAVPLGASTFLLRCFSIISISVIFPNILVACFDKFINTFTPNDVFDDINILVNLDASFILSSCSSLNPVVAITIAILLFIEYSSNPSKLDGCEKSIKTSHFSFIDNGDSYTG